MRYPALPRVAAVSGIAACKLVLQQVDCVLQATTYELATNYELATSVSRIGLWASLRASVPETQPTCSLRAAMPEMQLTHSLRATMPKMQQTGSLRAAMLEAQQTRSLRLTMPETPAMPQAYKLVLQQVGCVSSIEAHKLAHKPVRETLVASSS